MIVSHNAKDNWTRKKGKAIAGKIAALTAGSTKAVTVLVKRHSDASAKSTPKALGRYADW